jgi:hypothetical protein
MFIYSYGVSAGVCVQRYEIICKVIPFSAKKTNRHEKRAGTASILPPVIHTIDRDGTERWFDLNGRQLSGKPTQEGIYINKGNKVVIK